LIFKFHFGQESSSKKVVRDFLSNISDIFGEAIAKIQQNRYLSDFADICHWTKIHILLRVGNLRSMANIGENAK